MLGIEQTQGLMFDKQVCYTEIHPQPQRQDFVLGFVFVFF
jgi:hypothetical protein